MEIEQGRQAGEVVDAKWDGGWIPDYVRACCQARSCGSAVRCEPRHLVEREIRLFGEGIFTENSFHESLYAPISVADPGLCEPLPL